MPPNIDRRRFLGLVGAGAAAAAVAGCARASVPRGLGADVAGSGPRPLAGPGARRGYEYIVVGSGAGGGPLAANLARAGRRVLLLEAGGDVEDYNSSIPAFHPLATEDPSFRWDYFVRHYADDAQQGRDSKFVRARNGVWYPRAGTLGGCTAHHAMITVYPHNGDWDRIAELTGDASWRAERMRAYFERLEHCRYVSRPSDPAHNPTRHGFDGWLTTETAPVGLLLKDPQLLEMVFAAGRVAGFGSLLGSLLEGHLDPNDWQVVLHGTEGLYNTPLATRDGRRTGPREYIREVQREFPGALTVRTHALVTRVLLDGDRRASGVEYLDGAHLYRADPLAGESGADAGVRRTVPAEREVILAAGAFNSPQLLKLSGVGPRVELQRLGIDVRVDLPGVGENLQDRYEVGVVSEMRADFPLLAPCTFEAPPRRPDPCFAQWQAGKGAYVSNGVAIGIIRKSGAGGREPDLYVFGAPGLFRGYVPGYSEALKTSKNHFTWCVLKAHTRNTAGRVTLRSADPRDVPEINFRYFDEGTDAAGEDLESVVEGVEFARRILAGAREITAREVVPGEPVQTRDEIRRFVRDEAWGHHASCTNRMGPGEDRMAVVDSRFRVHGTRGLRVVDASVFPRIPGFFIVTPIYMISEKATDAILEDAGVRGR